ncbi:MAG: cysteine hydrolase [Chloroflexi bacterium]|nr:cysteine hydrolase [Chloroflexota bacterium]
MGRSLAEKVNPKESVVIVIDMQNDFCHEDGAHGKHGGDLSMGQEMAPRLASFLEDVRRAGVPIIFARCALDEWSRSEVWEDAMDKRGLQDPPLCEEGTWGVEFYGPIQPRRGERVMTKHRNSCFIGTDLDLILRSRGIKTIILTGVATNGCVRSTGRDGYQTNYYVVFVEDCCATSSGVQAHEETMRHARGYAEVVSARDLVSVWQVAKRALAAS